MIPILDLRSVYYIPYPTRSILDPSGSFFPKQLSTMRLFSSSNFSARLIAAPVEAEPPLRISGAGLDCWPADPFRGPRTRLLGSLIFMAERCGGDRRW
jgi:hypothetical protein